MTRIPRKYSADQMGDYPSWGQWVVVWLDGVKIASCTEYDIDAGTVERLRLNSQGRIQVDPVRQVVATEVLTGRVEVTLRPETPDHIKKMAQPN